MNIAEKIEANSFWYDMDYCNGQYLRPSEKELVANSGVLIFSSNYEDNGELKTSGISFSPTEIWEFPDNSQLEVTYSGCYSYSL